MRLNLWLRIYGQHKADNFWYVPKRFLCQRLKSLLDWEEVVFVKKDNGIYFEYPYDNVWSPWPWEEVEEELDYISTIWGLDKWPTIRDVTDIELQNILLNFDCKIKYEENNVSFY